MQLVHSQLIIPERVKKPTPSQLQQQRRQSDLRRRRFADFQKALKDPEVIAIIELVRKVNPDWEPKFRA